MGRTTRWLRSLLGGKKDSKQHELQQQHSCVPSPSKSFGIDESKNFPKEKRRWSFRRSVKDYTHEVEVQGEARPSYIDLYIPETDAEQNRHAIAMAAATAAAADAAVAAAQAAAVVVRLTTTGCTSDHKSNLAKQEWAAIKIQTYFRRYLAMKALRALKGLVKLQALVRGHMVRKQAAATMRCMQALVKVQARIRARRVRMSGEGQTFQRQLLERRRYHMKSNNEMEKRLDETAKIVEMDTGRPNPSPKKIKNGYLPAHKQTSRKHMPASTFSFPSLNKPATHTSQRPTRSPPHIDQHDASPVLVSLSQSDCVTAPAISPRTFSGQHGHFEDTFSTAESSPQYFSATSKPGFQTGPFTPSRPDYFEAMLKEYSSFPNYMANTESSKAKTRSQSAPRQRPDYGERYSLPVKKRATITPPVESKMGYGSGLRMQRSSSQVGMGKNPQPNRPTTPQQEADEYGNARYGAYFEFYSTRR